MAGVGMGFFDYKGNMFWIPCLRQGGLDHSN